MTTDFHVSPSQLDTAAHCMRRWGWDKIAGLPRGENKYAARGSAVHNILENWLLKAQPPDVSTQFGAIAFSALSYLPQPMTPGLIIESGGKNIEREFDGVAWSYRKDWKLVLPDKGVVIGDHKTCSNPDRYGHFPIGVLDREAQPVLYAFDELYDGAPWVQLRWTDMTTSKPFRTVPQVLDVVPTVTLPNQVSIAEIAERFQAWNEFGRNLLTIRKKGVHPIRLPYNAGHCQAFGGPCPYKDHCKLTPEEELRSLMSTQQTQVPNDASGFLARLAQMSNTAAAVTQTAPVQVPAQPAPGFVPPTPAPAAEMAPPAMVTPQGIPVFNPPPGLSPVNQGFAFPPPAAPIAPPAAVVPPTTPGLDMSGAVQTFPEVAPQATVAPVAQQTQVQTTVSEPAKRKRRTKAEIAADQARLLAEENEDDAAGDPEVQKLYRDVAVAPHPPTIPAPAPNPDRAFRQDLVLAMAANVGYCALDSVQLGNRLEILMKLAEGEFE